MPKHYLTSKANEELKKLFRQRPTLERKPSLESVRYPLPVLAKADDDVPQYDLGTFLLMKNLPESMVVSSQSRDAYAICNIYSGDICTLTFYGGQNTGGFWGASKCGETVPDGGGSGTTCALMDDGTLGDSVAVTFSGVIHNADPQYPAGWVAASEAIINDSFTMGQSASVAREKTSSGFVVEPGTWDISTGCQRVYLGYHGLPLYDWGGFGGSQTSQINSMRLAITMSLINGVSIGFDTAIQVQVNMSWGFQDGDPYTTGQWIYAEAFGTNWEQVVVLNHGITGEGLYTSGNSYVATPSGGAEDDDPNHYEFVASTATVGPL